MSIETTNSRINLQYSRSFSLWTLKQRNLCRRRYKSQLELGISNTHYWDSGNPSNTQNKSYKLLKSVAAEEPLNFQSETIKFKLQISRFGTLPCLSIGWPRNIEMDLKLKKKRRKYLFEVIALVIPKQGQCHQQCDQGLITTRDILPSD